METYSRSERSSNGSGPGGDGSAEARRFLDALRRARWPIAIFCLVAVVGAVAVSAALPRSYTASASILKQVAVVPSDQVDVRALDRELQTVQRLLLTPDVLAAAARSLPGETVETLADTVQSSVDPDANVLYVTATAPRADQAAARANSVATAFVDQQRAQTAQRYDQARAALQLELDRLRAGPPGNAQQLELSQRLSEVNLGQATADADLRIAQLAAPPPDPTWPNPVRNGIIALVVALLVGVLVALGRDRLVPRAGSAREVSRLLELATLGSVPFVGGRLGRRRRMRAGIEQEGYQALASAVRATHPAESGPHVLVVTSALHGEGKSTVTARLGDALARSGHHTVIVSADLRWPTLHEYVRVPAAPGLAEMLEIAPDPALARRLDETIVTVNRGPRHGELAVLAAGVKPAQPSELLAGDALPAVVGGLRSLGYTYIVLDAPPLIGIADTLDLLRCTDSMLYVARLDRVTLDNILDARDVLDRVDVRPAGLFVIGARQEVSPYYLGVRRSVTER